MRVALDLFAPVLGNTGLAPEMIDPTDVHRKRSVIGLGEYVFGFWGQCRLDLQDLPIREPVPVR